MSTKAESSPGSIPAVSRETVPGQIQIVEFVLENEHFAIDLFDVKEVVEYTTITKLPNVPPYVRGIIDLRGEITTIVDLKHRLNIRSGTSTIPETSRIIVLDDAITASNGDLGSTAVVCPARKGPSPNG